jgi:hypothetical protein
LNQPVKCKHCGIVVQAKVKPAAAASVPAAKPPAVRPLVAESRPAAGPPLAANPFNGQQLGIAAAVPPPPTSALSPEDIFAPPADEPIIRSPRRRDRRRSSGLGVLVVGILVVLAGGGGIAYLASKHLGETTTKPSDDKTPEVQAATSASIGFRRRALAICVNNYLYANPVSYGAPDRNVHLLLTRLERVLRIPHTQVLELSDAAEGNQGRVARATTGKDKPGDGTFAAEAVRQPPIRPVIEKTIAEFLATSRAQDRIILLIAAHAAMVEDAAYLVPLEGDFSDKEHLIPVKWLFERLAACKARQKVLIVDSCRYDPSRGLERPTSGPMSAKLEAILSKPPIGVQLWSACGTEQYSYELDGTSIFLSKLFDTLEQKFNKKIQKAEDPLPIKVLADLVNKATAAEVDSQLHQKQTPQLWGDELTSDSPIEEAPPLARLTIPPISEPSGGMAKREEVVSILKEIQLPPIKLANEETAPLEIDRVLPFAAKTLEPYKADYASVKEIQDNAAKYPLRVAVLDVIRVIDKNFDRSSQAFSLMETFLGGSNDKIKKDIENIQRGPARVQAELESALERLEEAGKDRKAESSKRWQAHYDFIHAQILARIAYLAEYNLMLGKIRKDELPGMDSGAPAGGWRLASRDKLTSGKEYRDKADKSRKILEKLAKDHAGTPWEILAKRESMTALGLEWQATR